MVLQGLESLCLVLGAAWVLNARSAAAAPSRARRLYAHRHWQAEMHGLAGHFAGHFSVEAPKYLVHGFGMLASSGLVALSGSWARCEGRESIHR